MQVTYYQFFTPVFYHNAGRLANMHTQLLQCRSQHEQISGKSNKQHSAYAEREITQL